MGKAGKARVQAKRDAKPIRKYGTAEEKNATVAEIASIAVSIREIEACNVALATKATSNVIAIAKILGGVRPCFKHGDWGPWVEAEFKWSPRTTARYMSVYKMALKVPDLDQLNISISVLYLLAELRSSQTMKYNQPQEKFAEIIALARKQRVTMEMAHAILQPHVASRMEPVTKWKPPELTPAEQENKDTITRFGAFTRVVNTVEKDMTTKAGMDAFKVGLERLSRQSEEKFLRIVLDVIEAYVERRKHPSRFDGSNVHDGDPDFDLPHQWRQYEATMLKALGT
jgi:hypothetical protein